MQDTASRPPHAPRPAGVQEYLEADHARLDALLDRAESGPGAIDLDAFDQFRKGLLRHIGIEEKVLLPLARERRAGVALPEEQRLHEDHGAFATLLVVRPTREIVAAIRRRLLRHNPLEEGDDGVYGQVERLLSPGESAALVGRMRDFPQPPVAELSDHPRALARVQDLLRE